jgi:phosphatidylinositol alpha-mannosyltransferase
MRILIVCPYTWNRPGGVRTHIIDTAQALINLEHSVVVLTPSDGDPELPEGWSMYVEETSQPGNVALKSIHAGRTLEFGGTQVDITWLNDHTSAQIVNLIKVFNPDVIHFHTPWTPFLSVQVLKFAAQLRSDRVINSRFIATFHDTPSESGLGIILGKYLMPLVARYFMRAFDNVIAVSEPQSRYISRFSDQQIHVIPNGISWSKQHHESSVSLKSASATPFLLFLGRLEHRKGLFDALEAYRMIRPQYSGLKLIIAGDGPLRNQGEAFVLQHSLEQVEFLGRVSESDKWELMRKASIYLAPALYGESFGIVLLEAMSVGTPVVGYSNSGYKSLVSGYFDDQFAQPGDVNQLARIVGDLLSDTPRMTELSKKGIEFSATYRWDRIISKIVQLYEVQ